ncbi:tyrosine-protein phosphatase [Christensenellaceae bacterium OttesenSCG-928-M15]|nr:tyrosine-protein phosphatase [Christensenellaceae bacterium OttesenSCG-928-M15]
MLRRYPFSNTMNTRDLGGYPVASGTCTRYGRFLRSDVPASFTEDEFSFLLERNIATIIDLRSTRETEHIPPVFLSREGFSYHHCPLHGNVKIPDVESDMYKFYLAILEDASMIKRIMQLFANTDTGFFYHCSAGKDRTGVISALLLSLAGVGMEDILADYQVSYTYIYQYVQRMKTFHDTYPAWIGQSKPEYMHGFLSKFFEQYETAENYLLQIGLTTSEASNIRKKLIAS